MSASAHLRGSISFQNLKSFSIPAPLASLSFSNTSQRQHNSIQPIKNIDWFHFVVDVFVN